MKSDVTDFHTATLQLCFSLPELLKVIMGTFHLFVQLAAPHNNTNNTVGYSLIFVCSCVILVHHDIKNSWSIVLFRALLLCMLAHLNGTEPSVLLVAPVCFEESKMSTLRTVYCLTMQNTANIHLNLKSKVEETVDGGAMAPDRSQNMDM